MASHSEIISGDEGSHLTHHDQLYSMPELAQICHFCLTFQTPLKLPNFSRTDLQAALIAGTTGDDRQVSLLAELHFKLVREQGAKLERMIQDWEKAVIRKVTDNWRLEFTSNPVDGMTYDDLTVPQRIQILNALCHWKLESCAEIHKHLAAIQKESDTTALDALRATPIGYDDTGVAYWYFGDNCWVYAEDRPSWQSQTLQEFAVEFADAKRIRLSINFDPSTTSSSSSFARTAIETSKQDSLESTDDKLPMAAKLQISTIVEEEIDEDEDEDEPLPISKEPLLVKEEKLESSPLPSDKINTIPAGEPLSETIKNEQQHDVRPVRENRKMSIDMLCSTSSPLTNGGGGTDGGVSSPKPEPMEEDEHDVSEDRFMSTIISTRELPSTTTSSDEKINKESATSTATAIEPELVVVPVPMETVEKLAEPVKVSSPTKKRLHSDDETDVAKPPVDQPVVDAVVPKRRKTRFHDITRATDNTTAALVDKFTEPAKPSSEEEKKKPVVVVAVTKDGDAPTENDDGGEENFEILCEACQRSYDRRYLDPPLENRPMGEWRCFECLVNDARGWPRRRPSRSKSSKGDDANEDEDEKPSSKKKSPSSSSSSRSKSKRESSSGSSKKSSSKKSSSSRGSSSSSSKHKKSSSSSKKSSKKKKSSSSSSSSKHISSSSRRHHHSRHHHREEYEDLLKLAQSRKRERLAIEDARLDGAHLCPVSLDGPTGWRVVCSSVEGLKQIIEKLMGGSLEQDRLRGRLIMILKVEEKLELERLKKREQQLWQVLPRRQSSRVAIGRMKTQTLSGESAADDSDGDDEPEHGSQSRRSSRSSRSRGAVTPTGNGHGRERLALERESRLRRRRNDDDSESESESDSGDKLDDERSVDGWIEWSNVTGDQSLTMVCSAAVDRLLKEEIAELFARPVDPEEDGCPDYLTVIEKPMDLGTIRQRVDSGLYTTWNMFKMDVDRVWSNCRKYNAPDMAVVEYADTLDQMFKQMRKEAERKGVRKMQCNDATIANGGKATGAEDEDEPMKSSDDEEEDEHSARKTATNSDDSSASEVSSVESDDSSDASSADSDAEATTKTKTTTSRKPRRSSATSRRPSRSSSTTSSSRKPTRAAARSAAPSSSISRGKSSRRRSKAHSSDSEEDEEDEDEAISNSGESEEEDAESDNSDEPSRRKSSSRKPSASLQRIRAGVTATTTATRPERRSTTGGKEPKQPPALLAGAAESSSETKKASAHRNRIESSDSSSSDGSIKGDSSSSSSEESDAENENETSVAPSSATVSATAPPPPASPSHSASSPPPVSPSPPSPPPPPTTTGSTRKTKPSSSTTRPRATAASVSNPRLSDDSSSSYFSSSESDDSSSSDSDSD